MEKKHLNIEIPEGFEIDKDNSTFERIVFKPIEKWVDLGLPSGTLWALENEDDYYRHENAVNKFTSNLPNMMHFAELLHYCKYKFDENKKEMVFIGPNGNRVFFPAAGSRYHVGDAGNRGNLGYYWSSDTHDSSAYYLYFDSSNVGMSSSFSSRAYGYSVRLIKEK